MSSNTTHGAATNATNQTTSRRVLGDMSPNVRKTQPSGLLERKPMAGSPLKRTFNASMEDGSGFTYLKKRKLSDDMPLSEMSSFTQSSLQGSNFVTQNALQLSADPASDQPAIPTFQQTFPTQPNSPVSSDHGDDGHESGEERRSFSSLINYDPSSQTAVSSQNVPGPLLKGPSHAQLLKLRLRVAMYKVKTNQVSTPFEELKEESNIKQEITPSDVEEEVAALRREAQARMGQLPVPRLLPAPVLLPTSYSSRMIYDAPIPSSPPAPHQHAHYSNFATPRRVSIQSEKDLTSSIIKGRVAEGLLDLKHAV